ncbi:superoxide dismutase [Brevundimonas goettingensis]|uniref:Superoxide dismutase n=1 Tax=Brevundimonas goettingensis TaxID=2774190 RepID=A0A975C043_9CAUL|nr:superoxide dismutase [Brevundimonas goettingensis]QTC90419.1 hypothetical protein IFJ75_14200 [Brevundimonas goettingensis]
MIRKTALLTGIAGLMLTAAPAAFAQDATQDPAPAPTPAPAAAPATATAPAQQPGTLSLQPGSDVKGSDGAVLGKLEGVRDNAGAQELTVRGTDGQLKGVPLAGLKPEGAGVVVGWTTAEFTAAPAIPGSAPDAASSAAPASTEAPPQPALDSASPEATPSTTETPVTEPTPTETPAPEEPAAPPVQPQA